jgi:geranylgeranyl reductase family protein
MEARDVVVVGGGPAGSTCAWRLRRAGVDVLVLDKAVFPRDKPCAGWVTPAALDALELKPADYDADLTLQAFSAFETGLLGGRLVQTRYGAPVSYGIRRREFDHFLLRRSGAPWRGGVAVTSLRRAGGAWIVNEAIRTPVLVGAGGHFCPVARALNGPPKPAAVVTAQEIEFRMDARQQAACAVAGTTPRLYFTRDLLGYGWVVRKGDHLNVGLGVKGAGRLRERVRGFVEWLRRRGEVPPGMPEAWRGHAYLLYEDDARLVAGDSVLLVGDAAGLAVRASGEGIRPAIESGRMAADAILEAGGRTASEDLAGYERRLGAAFGRRPARPKAPSALGPLVAPALLRSRWFARHVLLDRWFLEAGRTADGRRVESDEAEPASRVA